MRRLFLYIIVIFSALLSGFTLVEAQTADNLTIFRDANSITLYIPANVSVSLEGFSFGVETEHGPSTYSLKNFTAFRGLALESVQGPVCIRLEGAASQTPLPNACEQPSASGQLFSQALSDTDVFWYDTAAQTQRIVLVLRGSTVIKICGQNARCDFSLPEILPPSQECLMAGVLCDLVLYPKQFASAREFLFPNNSPELTEEFTEECAISGAYGLRLTYGFGTGEFGGWGISWDAAATLHDLSGFSGLIFWIKGASGNENFDLGIKDTGGNEPKAEINDFVILKPGEWMPVTLPFDRFNPVNLSSIENINLGFNQNHSGSTICIDNLAFVSFYTANSTEAINARSCPSTTCEVVANFDPDTLIPIVDIVQGESVSGSDDWALAIYQGVFAYVHRSVVEPPAPISTANTGTLIADFNTCNNLNNLGGEMGAAYPNPNSTTNFLTTTYENDPQGGCYAKLYYKLDSNDQWGGFWLKLNTLDSSLYTRLAFDVRADSPLPSIVYIEFKDVGNFTQRQEISGVTENWQPKQVEIPTSGIDRSQMNELVFVFVIADSGQTSTVYIDNIRFVP